MMRHRQHPSPDQLVKFRDLRTLNFEPAGAVAAHEAAVDPHPVYLTDAEADALYLTEAQADLLYEPLGGGGGDSGLTLGKALQLPYLALTL